MGATDAEQVKRLLIGVLRNQVTQSIYIKIERVVISGKQYERVASELEKGGLTVRLEKLPAGVSGGFQPTGEAGFRFSPDILEKYQQSQLEVETMLVHESTHAALFLTTLRVTRRFDEVMAYTAENVYRNLVHGSNRRTERVYSLVIAQKVVEQLRGEFQSSYRYQDEVSTVRSVQQRARSCFNNPERSSCLADVVRQFFGVRDSVIDAPDNRKTRISGFIHPAYSARPEPKFVIIPPVLDMKDIYREAVKAARLPSRN